LLDIQTGLPKLFYGFEVLRFKLKFLTFESLCLLPQAHALISMVDDDIDFFAVDCRSFGDVALLFDQLLGSSRRGFEVFLHHILELSETEAGMWVHFDLLGEKRTHI